MTLGFTNVWCKWTSTNFISNPANSTDFCPSARAVACGAPADRWQAHVHQPSMQSRAGDCVVPADRWQAHVHLPRMQSRKHDHSSRLHPRRNLRSKPVPCCCCCFWLLTAAQTESLCSWDWDTCVDTHGVLQDTRHRLKTFLVPVSFSHLSVLAACHTQIASWMKPISSQTRYNS